MDETYVKVNGRWAYLYRAVDNRGRTVDFYLSSRRNRKSAFPPSIPPHMLHVLFTDFSGTMPVSDFLKPRCTLSLRFSTAVRDCGAGSGSPRFRMTDFSTCAGSTTPGGMNMSRHGDMSIIGFCFA